LECDFRLPVFALGFRARLREITPDGDLKFWSDDRASKLSLQVLSSAEFAYTDGVDITGSDRFEGILIIILRSGKEDTISFAEVLE